MKIYKKLLYAMFMIGSMTLVAMTFSHRIIRVL